MYDVMIYFLEVSGLHIKNNIHSFIKFVLNISSRDLVYLHRYGRIFWMGVEGWHHVPILLYLSSLRKILIVAFIMPFAPTHSVLLWTRFLQCWLLQSYIYDSFLQWKENRRQFCHCCAQTWFFNKIILLKIPMFLPKTLSNADQNQDILWTI